MSSSVRFMVLRSLASCPALLAILLVARAAAADASDADGWSRRGDTVEGRGFSYQVFSQDSGEGFVRYQARGRIEALPEDLVGAVRVVASDPERAPDGQTRRVLVRDERGFTVHTHIDLPALFSDRDIVTRGEDSLDPETGARRIDWRAIAHEDAPPVDGTVRIERSAGFWSFTPDGGGSRVVYETYVDLGGSLPGWLVQPLMKSLVGETFETVARDALGR